MQRLLLPLRPLAPRPVVVVAGVVGRGAAVPPAPLLAAPPVVALAEPVGGRGRRLGLPRLHRGRRGHALPVAGDGAGTGAEEGRAGE